MHYLYPRSSIRQYYYCLYFSGKNTEAQRENMGIGFTRQCRFLALGRVGKIDIFTHTYIWITVRSGSFSELERANGA